MPFRHYENIVAELRTLHIIGPRESQSNNSGSMIVKISEELFQFCKLGQASTRLPPTSAQVLGERREQTS